MRLEQLDLSTVGTNGVYLRSEGNGEWSIVQLNCIERLLRYLFYLFGCYSSTHLSTVVANLNAEITPPSPELVGKITACWDKTYPKSVCPLESRGPLIGVPVVEDEVPAADAVKTPVIENAPPKEGYVPKTPSTVNTVLATLSSGGATITIERGDLLESGVPCIVNAANPRCLGGGGIDGYIHQAAGNGLYELCLQLPILEGTTTRCKLNDAVITGSANLVEKGINYIIHAVGPMGGDRNRNSYLKATYHNILRVAKENGIRRLAIPSISTGIFGFPHEDATKIAIYMMKALLCREGNSGHFDEVKLVFDTAEKSDFAVQIVQRILAETSTPLES